MLLGLSCISIITSSLRLFQCPCFPHFPPIFFLLSHFSKRFLRRHALAQLSNKPSRRVSRADAVNSGSRLASLHLPLAQHQRPSQFQAMSSRTAGLLKSRVRRPCWRLCKCQRLQMGRKQVIAYRSCSPCLSLALCATSRRPLNTTITTPVPQCVGNVHLPQLAQTSALTTGSNASQSITGGHDRWKNGSSSKTLLPLWSKSLTTTIHKK